MDHLSPLLSHLGLISSSSSSSSSSCSSCSSTAGAPSHIIVISLLAVAIPLYTMWSLLSKPKWDPKGQHVLVTGGSQGLGLAVAELLAERGAHVTICARGEEKLRQAVDKIKSRRASPSQLIAYVASDLSTFSGAEHAVRSSYLPSDSKGDSSSSRPTSVPTTIFCCAGGAKPGFFVQQTEEDFDKGYRLDYMTAVGTAHAATKLWVPLGVKGKIVFVSSTLGLMGLVGYSQYTPMKHAIRGLAESLRSELQLYSITVHAYFPGTILSPGFQTEEQTKPALTKALEGDAEKEGMTPEACAKGLIKGVEKGSFFITTDFLSELFRGASATGGSVPGNGFLRDRVVGFIAGIGLPIWRSLIADRSIRAHRAKHFDEELKLPLPQLNDGREAK